MQRCIITAKESRQVKGEIKNRERDGTKIHGDKKIMLMIVVCNF